MSSRDDVAAAKTAHQKVTVLMITFKFKTVAQKETFKATWAPLAQIVFDTEPNCLSYEFCDHDADPLQGVIYERYVAGDDLDVVHQETLKAFDMDSRWPAGFDT